MEAGFAVWRTVELWLRSMAFCLIFVMVIYPPQLHFLRVLIISTSVCCTEVGGVSLSAPQTTAEHKAQ